MFIQESRASSSLQSFVYNVLGSSMMNLSLRLFGSLKHMKYVNGNSAHLEMLFKWFESGI